MGPGPSDYNRIVQGAQGTMGIVTWAVCNCCLMPTIQHPYFIASEKMENLTTFIYKVLGKRLGEELFMVNNFVLANMMANLSDSIKSVCADLPPWIVFLNVAGFERRPEERIDYQEKDIREIAQQSGVMLAETVGGMSSSQFLNMINEPQTNGCWKLKYKGNCQDLFFLTTLDRVQGFIEQAYNITSSHGYSSHEIGIYVQPIVQGTSCHCEFSFMYDPDNARERENAEKLYLDLAKSLADFGAFYGRPYGVLSDIAYRRDAETTAVLRKIKAVFDPENILNPGKLCY